jgi:hypothetical protein
MARLFWYSYVGDAIAVAGQNYLPGVPTLSNMMSDVNHDNAGEAGHWLKLSERIAFAAEAARNFCGRIILFPHREKKWCQSRLSPHLTAAGLLVRIL